MVGNDEACGIKAPRQLFQEGRLGENAPTPHGALWQRYKQRTTGKTCMGLRDGRAQYGFYWLPKKIGMFPNVFANYSG